MSEELYMIVDPALLVHPKYGILRKKVGAGAVEYLIRLWAHCQNNKRGENWGNVSEAYVEAVAEWRGDSGKLYKALIEPPGEGKAGWIERDGDKHLIVHHWNDNNSALIHAWNAHRKSKAVSPAISPEVSGDTPMKTDGLTNGLREGDAHIPTEEEVIAYGGMGPGIHPEYCREYHAKKNERQGWIVNGGKLLDWRKEITRHWASWGLEWLGRYKKRAAGGEVQIDGMSIDDCRAELLNPAITEQRRQELINMKKRLECK